MFFGQFLEANHDTEDSAAEEPGTSFGLSSEQIPAQINDEVLSQVSQLTSRLMIILSGNTT